MKISSLYSPFVLLSLFCQSIASPAHIKRDAKGNVVTIRLKKTIQQTQTNYYTVDSPTATYTNTVVNTNTKTVTRYTATVTSTVFGVPHTYTTVATTPVSAADVIPNSENEVKTPLSATSETTADTS